MQLLAAVLEPLDLLLDDAAPRRFMLNLVRGIATCKGMRVPMRSVRVRGTGGTRARLRWLGCDVASQLDAHNRAADGVGVGWGAAREQCRCPEALHRVNVRARSESCATRRVRVAAWLHGASSECSTLRSQVVIRTHQRRAHRRWARRARRAAEIRVHHGRRRGRAKTGRSTTGLGAAALTLRPRFDETYMRPRWVDDTQKGEKSSGGVGGDL